MRFKFLLIITFILLTGNLVPAYSQSPDNNYSFWQKTNDPWVDSIMKNLSKEEQIAQLIFVAAYSNSDISREVAITDLIRKYKIGGLIFFEGNPVKQAKLTNFYQSESKVPLMIAMDAEWGLGMRLNNTIKFPFQMTLGAIQNDSLIYQMGGEIGRELKRIGVHLNLAPVVDINNNPSNPVINYRSFGMDKKMVATKGIMYMKGMQDEGIIASAKHFPGHGDTDIDSHLALPVISHDRNRLESLELFPFKKMIEAGVGSIMVAHLNVPSLDPTPKLASTLSKPIVTNLLKKELGFKGLILTDALNMKGVSSFYPPGIVDAKALVAGNDVLEFTESVPKAIEEIKKAADAGQISWKEIEKRCRKVLAAKLWLGLDHPHQVELKDLNKDLNSPDAQVLNIKLIRAALTVLKNEDNIIPVKDLANTRIATLAMRTNKLTNYQKMLGNYTQVDHFFWDPEDPDADNVFNKLKSYDLVIAGFTNLDQRPYKNFGIDAKLKNAMTKLIQKKNVIISVFGNPFSLDKLPGIENSKALIITYQNNRITQEQAAQLIFGAIGANGTLPVGVNKFFKLGDGIQVKSIGRLAYTLPEEEEMSSYLLENTIDSIAESSINLKVFPGCEVLVARNGAVVFNKTYGYHTYEKKTPVTKDNLYDFASVTKATGPLPAIMQMVDEGKINLDAKFSTYWPSFKNSNKKDLEVREILAHQAGLQSWIAFWKNTVKENGKFKFHTFKFDSTSKYNVQVDDNLWLFKNYRKKMYTAIKKSPVSEEKKYLYSGLSFYLYPQIIKNLTGEDYEHYLKEHIYRPLGAYTMTFNPYRNYSLERIPPTEDDTFFRKKQIHGHVHDEGASMMGGISGNAGLFATANDLAKLLQMYLQMGSFGGEVFIKKPTMKEFSRSQFPDNNNRRGLGFDKPLLNNELLGKNAAYPAKSASPSSFGHSGYTGTFAWVDPEKNIIYVFFSNRVYPTRENNLISKMNIRSKVLQAVYDSIKN